MFDVQIDRVTIGVPQRSRDYRLTVLGVSENNEMGPTWMTLSQDTIFPPENSYEVKELDPGTEYKICLGSLDEAEDFLCCKVETKTAITTATSKVQEDTEQDVVVEKENDEDKLPHVNQNKVSTLKKLRTTTKTITTTNWQLRKVSPVSNNQPKIQSKTEEEQDSSMMYPLLGAGLAAFVILILGLMLFLCQHNKRKLEQTMGEMQAPPSGGHRYSNSIKYTARPQYQDQQMYETSEMMTTQPSYHFQPVNGVSYTQVPTFPHQQQPKYLTGKNFDGASSLARSNVSQGSSQQRYSPASLPFSSNPFSSDPASKIPAHEQMTSSGRLVQGSPRNVVTMPTTSSVHGNGCVSSNLVQYRSAVPLGNPFNQNTVSSSSSHHSNRSRTLATNNGHHHDNRRSYGSNYGVIYDTGYYPLIPTNERTISEHVTATPVM